MDVYHIVPYQATTVHAAGLGDVDDGQALGTAGDEGVGPRNRIDRGSRLPGRLRIYPRETGVWGIGQGNFPKAAGCGQVADTMFRDFQIQSPAPGELKC